VTDEHHEQLLAEQFEAHRGRLRAVAFRVLGSADEADDAVQEAWLRLSRADAGSIDNLGAWLTTVVSRVALTMLQSHATRREATHRLPEGDDEPVAQATPHPEDEAVLADSVGVALMVVLDTLTPAERLAFVLHDLFAVPFDDVAAVLDRSPAATRQLASRARRRVQGADPDDPSPEAVADRVRQREVVEAFLAASREGDFAGLLRLLDPAAEVRADATTVAQGAEPVVRGASAVAESFAGRARAARPALVDGVAGLVWTSQGVPRVVFAFTVVDGRVTGIELLSNPETLASLDVRLLRD
jgi:RNA polymerase sigma-70 factor (ECF subfamily)